MLISFLFKNLAVAFGLNRANIEVQPSKALLNLRPFFVVVVVCLFVSGSVFFNSQGKWIVKRPWPELNSKL